VDVIIAAFKARTYEVETRVDMRVKEMANTDDMQTVGAVTAVPDTVGIIMQVTEMVGVIAPDSNMQGIIAAHMRMAGDVKVNLNKRSLGSLQDMRTETNDQDKEVLEYGRYSGSYRLWLAVTSLLRH